MLLKWLAQVAVLGLVLGVFATLVSEAVANWSRSGITFGWDWLSGPFGVALSEGIDTAPDSGARALVVGAINTLRIAVAAIVASTVLGTLVGVARLSNNWIIHKVATWFVETVRNIPLLLQIFFWQALTFSLPALTETDVGTYWAKVSKRGFGFAWIRWNGGFWPWLVFFIAGVIVGRFLARRLRRRQRTSRRNSHPGLWFIATVALFGIVGWFAWPLLRFMAPIFSGIADTVESIPAWFIPLLGALASIFVASRWLWSFFRRRRSAAGYLRLNDDDWFWVGFAVLAGLGSAIVILMLANAELLTTSGETMSLAELLQVGIANMFDWMGNNFNPDTNQPLVPQKVSVVRSGNFYRYGDTGAVMTIPFFSVWVAITTYTAAFIAEIVRGGVQAVEKGQADAAMALGLNRRQAMLTVILPQAFRIILPPLGNQYINVVKNSSLGVATAVPDIMNVGITIINQTGEFRAVVLVWIMFFLGVSLAISGLVNAYNRKMNLVSP